MKKTPDQQRDQDNLASSAFSADGFLGTDPRDLAAILAADQETVDRLGATHEDLARKLRRLARLGAAELGRPAAVGPHLEVSVEEHRGAIPCPFRDAHRVMKRITTVTDVRTGESLRFTDLNVHMIEAHGFYEGKDSAFRVEPEAVVKMLEGLEA
jgi:hypothetical protein